MSNVIAPGHEVVSVISKQWKLDITDAKLYKCKGNELILAATVIKTVNGEIRTNNLIDIPVKIIRETVEVYKNYI